MVYYFYLNPTKNQLRIEMIYTYLAFLITYRNFNNQFGYFLQKINYNTITKKMIHMKMRFHIFNIILKK